MSQFWKNKKVLITGHSGFKGSWLSAFLIDAGAEVTGYSLKPVTDPNLFTLAKLDSKLKSHWNDIRDFKALKSAVKSATPDFIFHLAAQPLVKIGYEDPVETFSTNAIGTMNLLEACREMSSLKGIVNVTTDKVYSPDFSTIYQESDKLGGNDPYSASKACSEIITHSYRQSFYRDSSVKVASARAGNVIGGGDWAEARLVPDFIRAHVSKNVLHLRNLKGVRPWQHVLDSISGYTDLAEYLATGTGEKLEAFNFAPHEHDRTVADFLESADKQFPLLKVQHQTVSSDFHEEPSIRLDSSLATKTFNWKSRWNFDQSIHYTIDWYLRHINGEDPWTITQTQIQAFKKS